MDSLSLGLPPWDSKNPGQMDGPDGAIGTAAAGPARHRGRLAREAGGQGHYQLGQTNELAIYRLSIG